MDKIRTYEIAKGAEGNLFLSDKFKKSVLSVSFYMPLSKEDSTANTLLSSLLTRGTKDYSSYTALNARLNELYGASISSGAQSVGDMQQIIFKAVCLDDKYTNGEHILGMLSNLLCDMLFEPLMSEGKFYTDNFESEKRLLCESIKAELNDKRHYALQKLNSLMFKDEPYGISSKGELNSAEAITNEQTAAAYNKLMKSAFVNINLLSNEPHDEIFDMFKERFGAIERDAEKINITKKHIQSYDTQYSDEQMDVTQGKLCMGFSLDSGDTLYDSAVLRVLCDIFGGGTYSRLFTNVREKQSLCYYCAAIPSAAKSVITVDSGILDENRERARQSILNELEALKNGDIDDDLLNISKKSLIDGINSAINDSILGTDAWYSARVYQQDDSVDGYLDALQSVKLCDVLNMAKTIKLDTVYYLGANKE